MTLASKIINRLKAFSEQLRNRESIQITVVERCEDCGGKGCDECQQWGITRTEKIMEAKS